MNIERHLKDLLVKTCKNYNVAVPKFRLSKALKASNGVCKLSWDPFTLEVLNSEIVISKLITDHYSVKTAEETLYHEIAHYIDFIKNGVLDHGYSFKKLCVELGGTMNSRIATGQFASAASGEYVSKKVGYIYKCPCGKCDYKTIRKIQEKMLVRRYCRNCGTYMSEFKIEEL